MLHDAPFILPPECDPAACVECLDAAGRPLFVTSRPQRTGLVRRWVALIMTAPGGRTHLWQQPRESEFPLLWSLSACGPVLVGEALEDAAWRLIREQGYWQEALQILADTPALRTVLTATPSESASLFPVAVHGHVHTTVFTTRLPVLPPSCQGPVALRRYPDHIWLDAEELTGFLHSFADRISPLAELCVRPSARSEKH